MIVTAEIIAQKYAIAFCRVYGKDLTSQSIERLQSVMQFFKKQRNFLVFAALPKFSDGKRRQIIEKLCQHFNLGPGFEKLMLVLLQHKRLDMLNLIIKHIVKRYLKLNAILVFSVYTSHPLQEQEKQRIINFIGYELPQQTAKVDFFIDTKLISGVRIKGDTLLWERSINRLLRDVNRTMLQRVGL